MLPNYSTGYPSTLFPVVNADRSPSPAFIPTSEDFVELLRSPDFDTRLQTLNRLMTMVKRDPDWFPKFTKKGELFKSLDKILTEDRWEVQHQMIKFLMDAMPSLGANLEYCACYLMPNLLPKLGSSKVTVRRITVQAIQMFLRLVPQGLPAVLKMLSNNLLGQMDRSVRLEIFTEIPSLFISEQKQGNWKNLIDVLTKMMLSSDKEIIERAGDVLRKLQVFIGSEASARLLAEVSDEQKQAFQENIRDMQTTQQDEHSNDSSMTMRSMAKSGERRFRYGIVPTYVETMLNDDEASTRMAALEKLKAILERITPDELNKFTQHLHSYFVRIGHVLEDLNFKVVVMALDLIRLTVNRLKQNIEAHLQQVVQLIARHFGNQKAVVKQIIMMTFQDLFHNLVPKKVVAQLSAYLTDKNSRVREEVLNILTVAIMNSNPGRINFTAVCNMLVPMLIDTKRRVRLAAFEQLSVVAYLMDGKIEPMMRAVRDTEEKHSLVGLAHAVLARLGRHILPRIRSDGLLEYATPPITDNAFDVEPGQMKESENADLQWILHANSGDSGERPISPISMIDFKMKARRPRTSKGRSLMPWEEVSPSQEAVCVLVPQPIKQRIKEPEPSPPPFVERMLSDDQIVRQSDSKEAIHPGESTNSWHSPGPKRNNSVAAERSTSAINRLNGDLRNELDTSLDRIRFNALQKRTELNNNNLGNLNGQSTHINGTIKTKAKVQKKNSTSYPINGETLNGFGRAKSETQLAIEDRENRHPINNDEQPIRPAKIGMYHEDFTPYPSENFSNGLVKKSVSHHSLPTTTKNKKHTFLKSGAGSRVKPAPLSSNAAPIGANRHSAPAGGGISGALKLMSSEEWQDKIDGINQICDLSSSNPSQVAAQIHEVCVALLEECKNLRSSVSRVAISTISTLFENLKGKMDGELEKIGTVLMSKSGDVSNAFIRDDANDALDKMITYGSPIKVLSVLIHAGSKSKNNTCRASCSQFVAQLVQRVSVSNAVNSTDLMAKLIPILIIFAKDQTPNVRQHAKATLLSLSENHNFETQLKKACMDSDVRTAKEILGHIHKKGGADFDSTSTSLAGSLSRNGSFKKSAVLRKLPDNLQLDLDECRKDLSAAGWENRLIGLKRFEELTKSISKAVAGDTKLIEAFIGRLSDINGKVSLEAMDVHLATLPQMSRHYSVEASLKAVLNQLLLSLSSHLPSKSEEHRALAQKCLNETIRQIDNSALAPAVAAATRKANVKQKPFMLHVFSKVNENLYPTKPKQVEILSLPVLIETIKAPPTDAENKKANQDFARSLARLMGEKGLMDAVGGGLDPSKRQQLDAMIKR